MGTELLRHQQPRSGRQTRTRSQLMGPQPTPVGALRGDAVPNGSRPASGAWLAVTKTHNAMNSTTELVVGHCWVLLR